MVLTLLGTLVWAQAPAEPTEPAEPTAGDESAEPATEPGDELQPSEIVVYGERLVDQARREVVETLEELGYDYEVKDQGDRVIYRHPAPWYGEVVLHDEGWMRVKRQKIRVEGRAVPWAKKRNSVGAWLGCFVYPWACIRVYGATVSRRRWMGTQSRTVAELAPKVETLGDRIADLATSRRVAALPGQLEALWDEGTPFDARQDRVDGYPNRRSALLQHWASRTDTVWGRMIRRSIEDFIEAVVQPSDHPFTPDEIAAFNDGRLTPIVLPSLLRPEVP